MIYLEKNNLPVKIDCWLESLKNQEQSWRNNLDGDMGINTRNGVFELKDFCMP